MIPNQIEVLSSLLRPARVMSSLSKLLPILLNSTLTTNSRGLKLASTTVIRKLVATYLSDLTHASLLQAPNRVPLLVT